MSSSRERDAGARPDTFTGAQKRRTAWLRSATGLLLLCAAASPVGAQQSAADVTDAQVAQYKAAAEAGCKAGGQKQGDPQEKIDAFCGCVITTLSKSMTHFEWQQAFFFSQAKQSQQEMQLLAPHMKRLDACRPER